MNEQVWVLIAGLSLVSVGFGFLLGLPGNRDRADYDERQLIERGKGAHVAMLTAVVYLMSMYVALECELADSRYMLEMTVWGLVLVMLAFNGYIIFHDAYVRRDRDPGIEVFYSLALGVVWLFLGFGPNETLKWFDFAIAIAHLGDGMMLLSRILYLKLRDRMEAQVDSNG